MRLGISTIFPKHVLARKKLHVMSSHDRVAEMPPVLPQLFRAARKTLAQDGSLSSQNLEHLRGLICSVGLEELGFPSVTIKDPRAYLNSLKPSHPLRQGEVTYIHLYEDPAFTLGIFMLPEGASIPMHNHPGMTVISRLLWGSLHVCAMDLVGRPPRPAHNPEAAWASPQGATLSSASLSSANTAASSTAKRGISADLGMNPANVSSSLMRPLSEPSPPMARLPSRPSALSPPAQPPSQPPSPPPWLAQAAAQSALSAKPGTPGTPGRLRLSQLTQSAPQHYAQLKVSTTITAPTDSLLVTPSSMNLHEFKAVGGPVAVLDLLTPPYDSSKGRDCTYYRTVQPRAGAPQPPPWLTLLEEFDAPDFTVSRAPYTGIPFE